MTRHVSAADTHACVRTHTSKLGHPPFCKPQSHRKTHCARKHNISPRHYVCLLLQLSYLTHTHTHTHTHTYTQTHLHTNTPTQKHTHIQSHTHKHTPVSLLEEHTLTHSHTLTHALQSPQPGPP